MSHSPRSSPSSSKNFLGAFEPWIYSSGTASTVLTAIVGGVAALTGSSSP